MLDMTLVFLNIGYIFYLICFLCRDIMWLRIFTVLALFAAFPYYLFRDSPLWVVISWSAVYVIINLVYIGQLYIQRRPIRLAGIEQEMFDMVFDVLHPRTFHRIFKISVTEKLDRGAEFISQGQELKCLYLVADGKLEVALADGTRRILRKGSFVGEQSFLTGDTASATVRVLDNEVIVLGWKIDPLRKILDEDVALSNTFDLILTTDIISKLRRMTSNN